MQKIKERIGSQPRNDNVGGTKDVVARTVTVIAYLGSGVWTCIWERMSKAIPVFLLD